MHLVDQGSELSPREQDVLSQLLHYGPRQPLFARAPEAALRQAEQRSPVEAGGSAREQNAAAQSIYVVPRLGTISPWSSKATDIAQLCGLRTCVASNEAFATGGRAAFRIDPHSNLRCTIA